MRAIKFRAWVEENKKMYEDVTFDKLEVQWFDPKTKQDPDDPEPGCWVLIGDRIENSLLPYAILMEYTGLKDKNGKEIYEGDIVKADFNSPREPSIMTVVFGGHYEYAAFGVTGKRELGEFGADPTWDILSPRSSRDIEIIGNIYENPELLSEKK